MTCRLIFMAESQLLWGRQTGVRKNETETIHELAQRAERSLVSSRFVNFVSYFPTYSTRKQPPDPFSDRLDQFEPRLKTRPCLKVRAAS